MNDTNQISSTIEQVNSWLTQLDKIHTLGASGIVFLGCFAVGYALKFSRKFSTHAIAVIVIIFGGALMLVISDPKQSGLPMRIWAAREFIIGMVIATLAYIANKFLIVKVAPKFPSLQKFLGVPKEKETPEQKQ